MKHLKIALLLGIFLLLLSGCNPMGDKKLKVELKNPSAFKDLKTQVASVSVVNNQLVISGSSLTGVTKAILKNSSQEEVFQVESASDNQIIANSTKVITIIAGSVFDLILSDAFGSATYQVTFTVADGSITSSKLSSMGAVAGQYLKYNGSSWGAASIIDGQAYIGTWNATTNTPDLTIPSSLSGDYYVATVGGTFDGITYAVGDWIISDGYSWQKIPYSKTSVSSFQGRKGIVTLTPADYVSLKDGVTSKITGSSLNDIADIDLTAVAPTNGSVLKYNGTTWVTGVDSTGVSSGSIVDADVSATAAIAQSKISGLATSLTGKQDISSLAADVRAIPLTGLTSASGSIAATDSILGAFGKLMNTQTDYVSKSAGATIATGTIAVSGTGMITIPTATGVTATEAANVTYVNNVVNGNGVWNKSGSTINYTAGNVGIGISSPGYNLDVVGDVNVTGAFRVNGAAMSPNYQVRVVTTANITLSGAQTIDYVSVVAGDRVLVKNQTTGSQNGVYVAAAGAWSRALDMDTWAETIGYKVQVREGGYLAGMAYTSATATSGTLDTTSVNWYSNGSGVSTNTAFGYRALINSITGSSNTAFGSNSLAANSNGTQNTANGISALAANNGAFNTANGAYALTNSTTPNYNTANGNQALYYNTVGAMNTASGANALLNNVAKSESTAIGFYSMYYADSTSTVSTSYNTAIGAYSLQGSTPAVANTGTKNTALGHSALVAMKSGSGNIGLGYNSGSAITTGSNNVVIGSSTGSTIATSSNNILISDGAGNERMQIDSSGLVGIGGTPTSPLSVSTTAISGNIANFVSTGAGGAGCSIAWNGTSCSSDVRLKENIKSLTGSLDDVLKLQSVSFTWKKDEKKERQIGFIAQEIEKTFPEVVKNDTAGFRQVNYANLVAVATEAIKELFHKWFKDSTAIHREIAKKDREIAELKERLDKIEKNIKAK